MFSNIFLIIILTILPYRVGGKPKYQFYHCKSDVCYCCFENLVNNSINYNNNTRQLYYIQGKPHHVMTYLHTSVSKIKILFNRTVTIYECPYGSPSVYYSPNFYPLTRNLIQFVNLSKIVTTNVSHVDKIFQKCVKSYCKFETQKNNMLICGGSLIQFLNFRFTTLITSRCVQNITFVYIKKVSSAALLKSNFFDYAINVIVMHLHVTDHGGDTFRCSNFVRMKKLQLLDISSLTLSNIKCIFKFNPDMIRVSNREQTVWNMCHNRLEVYDIQSVHPYDEDIPQLDTTTEIIPEEYHPGFSHILVILISFLFLIIICFLLNFLIRNYRSSIVVGMPMISDREIMETYV